jgi:DNA-binding FadR family transcriptional regulator
MDNQLDELIREIAAKHGVAVSRDDPILILQTINSRLLNDSAALQKAQLDLFKEEMEGVSLRWQSDSKEKAERILNAALAANKEAMHLAIASATDGACEKIRNALEEAAVHATAQARNAQRAACINLASAGLLVLSLVIQVLWLRL